MDSLVLTIHALELPRTCNPCAWTSNALLRIRDREMNNYTVHANNQFKWTDCQISFHNGLFLHGFRKNMIRFGIHVYHRNVLSEWNPPQSNSSPFNILKLHEMPPWNYFLIISFQYYFYPALILGMQQPVRAWCCLRIISTINVHYFFKVKGIVHSRFSLFMKTNKLTENMWTASRNRCNYCLAL